MAGGKWTTAANPIPHRSSPDGTGRASARLNAPAGPVPALPGGAILGVGRFRCEKAADGEEDHDWWRAQVHCPGVCRDGGAARGADDADRAGAAASCPTGVGASRAHAAAFNRAAAALPALSADRTTRARPQLPKASGASARAVSSPRSPPRRRASSDRDAPPRHAPAFLEADDPPVPPDDLSSDHAAQILPNDDPAGHQRLAASPQPRPSSPVHAPSHFAPAPPLT